MKPMTRRSFIARTAATLTAPLWPRASVLSFQARDAGTCIDVRCVEERSASKPNLL